MGKTERPLMVETPGGTWTSMIDGTRLMSVRWPSGATVTGLYRDIPAAEHLVYELTTQAGNHGLRAPLALDSLYADCQKSSPDTQPEEPTLADLRLTLAIGALEERMGKPASEVGAATTAHDASFAIIRVPTRMTRYTVKGTSSECHAEATIWATSKEAARTAAAWRASRTLMKAETLVDQVEPDNATARRAVREETAED